MLDENGGCRKEKEREKFLQEQRIQRWYGAAVLKNPLESRGKGERAWGAPAAIGHSAIFTGIHASVPRGIYWKDFLPWYDLGESKSGPAKIWYSRERADLVRASPSSGPPPRCKCTRLAVLRALSSSLIEYSQLYLRMPVEIYRRSRCSFRFNLLRLALTSSVFSFPVFAYILRV